MGASSTWHTVETQALLAPTRARVRARATQRTGGALSVRGSVVRVRAQVGLCYSVECTLNSRAACGAEGAAAHGTGLLVEPETDSDNVRTNVRVRNQSGNVGILCIDHRF